MHYPAMVALFMSLLGTLRSAFCTLRAQKGIAGGLALLVVYAHDGTHHELGLFSLGYGDSLNALVCVTESLQSEICGYNLVKAKNGVCSV